MPPIFDTTIAGVPSRGIVYAKIMDLLRDLEDSYALMGHLHQTEGNSMDTTLAHGWLGMAELVKKQQAAVTALAMKKLQ